MSEKVYKGFISYAIKNYGARVTDSEWKSYFKSELGKKSDSSKLKNVALTLYYAHFASLSACVPYDLLISKNPTELKNLVIDSEDLKKKHKLPELAVMHYTDNKQALKHIEKFQESPKIMELKIREPETKKSTKKNIPKTTTVSKKKETSSKKNCVSHTLAELKKMAQNKDIKGRSKMSKSELCKALKIK